MSYSTRYLATKAQILRGGMAATYYNAIPCNRSIYAVTNEEQAFATHLTSGTTTDTVTLEGQTNIIGRTVDWTVDNRTNIISGSQIVSSGSTYSIATPGIDYTISYASGTVARLDSGNIPYGGTVYTTYGWEEPCVDVSTGSPNATCPQCSGRGYNWGSGTNVVGLPHIPSFDSPYTKIGYFQMGDMIFTVPEEYGIHVSYDGEDPLLIRDKIVVDGVDWRVIASPEKIQLGNEILARKLHCRPIKTVPGA